MVPFVAALFLIPYGTGFSGLSRKSRVLVLINLVSFTPLLIPVFFNLHYVAPMACASYALLLFAMRFVYLWRLRSDKHGKRLVETCVLASVVALIIGAAVAFPEPIHDSSGAYPDKDQQIERSAVISALEKDDRKKLVIVRYERNHNPHHEWVYNGADIDDSKIVWARAMSPIEDEQLRDYFKDRQVFLVDPDAQPPHLIAYPTTNSQENIDVSTKRPGN